MRDADCFNTIDCFAYHVQCWVEVQKGAQSLPNEGVVVGDQDAYAALTRTLM